MKKNRCKWSKREVKKLKKIYNETSRKNLLKIFPDKTISSIEYKLGLLNLRKKDRNKSRRNGDLNILLNKSSQSFYWLGFLFADGYINHKRGCLSLSCNIKDKNHINSFAKYISTKCKTYTHKEGGFNFKPHKVCVVSVSHPLIVNKLIKIMNFKPNKTYNPPSVEKLEKVLNTKKKFLSFFVGYVDGDGSIYVINKNRTSLSVINHKSWNDVNNFFIKQLIRYKIYNGISKSSINNKNKSLFQLRNTACNVKKEINKLKLDVLNRKWDKV